MTEKFEELYSELNAMDSQEIKNAIEEAIRKGCKNIIAPFEVRCIIEAQQETINRQNTEIERLTNIVDDGAEVCHNCHSKYAEKIKQAKADAIKEFADEVIADLTLLAKYEDEFRQSVILGVVHTIKSKLEKMVG